MIDKLYIKLLDSYYYGKRLICFGDREKESRSTDLNLIHDGVLDAEVFFQGRDIYVTRHYKEFFEQSGMHSHSCFEMVYVAKGTATHYLDGETIELRQGDLCIMSPNAVHNLDVPDDRQNIVLSIGLSVELFNNSFFSLMGEYDMIVSFLTGYITSRSEENNYILFRDIQTKETDAMVEALISETIGDRELFHNISIRCKLILLFTEIMRQIELRSVSDTSSEDSGRLREIILFIKDNYATVSLSSVAEHFHYHPNYLSSLISKSLNKSFSELVNEIRQTHAMYYLTQTSLPMKDISDLLGYKNLSSFYSAIKKAYDTTPKEIRTHGAGNLQGGC